MPEIPDLFVSLHAVNQFRQRIAPMSEVRARLFICEGIRRSMNIKLLPDGNTLRIRTRRPFPFEFRAFCVFDEARGHFVVTTIVRGEGSVRRKHRRRAQQINNPPDDQHSLREELYQ